MLTKEQAEIFIYVVIFCLIFTAWKTLKGLGNLCRSIKIYLLNNPTESSTRSPFLTQEGFDKAIAQWKGKTKSRNLNVSEMIKKG